MQTIASVPWEWEQDPARAAHCRNAGEEIYHPTRYPEPVSSGSFLVSALLVPGSIGAPPILLFRCDVRHFSNS
jgi:hypothetical protein